MAWIPEELKHAAKKIESEGQPFELTVRTLLSWYKSERRGAVIVSIIHAALQELGLETYPNFELVYLDGAIELKPRLSVPPQPIRLHSEAMPTSDLEVAVPDDLVEQVAKFADPVPRVGMLAAANRPPISTSRDMPLRDAVTIMLMHDFSQLPVMQGERRVNGIISWKSIGRVRSLGREPEWVRDCMDERVVILNYDMPLFDAVDTITKNEVVLVKDLEGRISGLVTTSDISLQFHALSEPFLLIGEIENHIRRILMDKFSIDTLASLRDPSDSKRPVDGIASLSFGEYIRLLENPMHFKKLGYQLSRDSLVNRLQDIRRIRNDVMHFHPDGISPDDLILLRDTVKFMQKL